MKNAFKVLLEIAVMMGSAIVLKMISDIIGCPCTYNDALLYMVISKVCQMAVDLRNKE